VNDGPFGAGEGGVALARTTGHEGQATHSNRVAVPRIEASSKGGVASRSRTYHRLNREVDAVTVSTHFAEAETGVGVGVLAVSIRSHPNVTV
jgi:hypothetical protein